MSDIKISKILDSKSLEDLFKERILAIIVPNFTENSLCNKIKKEVDKEELTVPI